MRRVVCFALAAALAGSSWAHGQDARAEIEQKLNSQFALTKITADDSDIVTPGSVLVLQKDGLVMYPVQLKVAPVYTYKDGRFSMGFGASLSADIALGAEQQGLNHSNVPQRKFVAGEKFWIVGAFVKDDGVYLTVYSDPYQDNIRYMGQIKLPFNKKVVPPADDVMRTIAEVVTVEPGNNPGNNTAQNPPPQPPPPPPAQSSLKPIPPPPPPPDAPPPAPKTISLGQTKDEVVAIMGQPQKVANLGTKEIDYYPDMKVTFVKGKVTDVQ